MSSPQKRPREHPLRRWIRENTSFKITRDALRVFGVGQSFLSQVMGGTKRPSGPRAFAWERITGIPAKRFILFNRPLGRRPRGRDESERRPSPPSP
jgi:hypothetical protein